MKPVTSIHFSEEVSNYLALYGVSVDLFHEWVGQLKRQALVAQNVVELIPMKEALETFDVDLRAETSKSGKHLVEVSLEEYKRVLKRFRLYAESQRGKALTVEDIPYLVKEFIDSAKVTYNLAITTVDKYTAILRRFLTFCNMIYHLDCDKPEMSGQSKLVPRALSFDDSKKLLDISRASQYGLRSHFMVSFLLGTGLRRNEFRQIQLRDIDWSKQELFVANGKGGKERVIPLPDDLVGITKEYISIHGITRPTDFLYGHVDSPSHPLSNTALDEQVRRLVSKLPSYEKGHPRFGYHMHSLRHTFAVMMLFGGTPLRILQNYLGHAHVSTTEIYTAVDTEGLREAGKGGLAVIGTLLSEGHVRRR